MDYTRKPDFRRGEDENFCGAGEVFREKRLKESSEDYILPDYLPDIKKVAAVFPAATIKGRFLGSGTLEYEGEACYKVLYVAEDQTLRTAVFLTGFEDKIGNEELTEDCVELLTPLCEGVNVRLLNPRKLNIRSQNGADVAVYKRRCYMPELYGARTVEDENKLQCETAEMAGMNVLCLRETGLTLSEDLSFEAAMPTAGELVFSFFRLVPQDCRVTEGEVQMRGTAEICCILSAGKDAEGKEDYFCLERSLTFSQTVKNNCLHAGGVCFAELQPEGSEFRLREDEFGQKRVVEADLTYLCDLAVFYPKNIFLMTDGFSLEKETELSTSEKEFCTLSSPLKGGFSVNETVGVDLPEEGGYRLFQCVVEPEMHLCEEGEKATLEGTAEVLMLLKDSAGAPDARRVSLPLRFRTEIPMEGKGEARVCCRASGTRYRLSGNRLSLDFEVDFGGYLLGKQSRRTVDILRILPEQRKTPGKRGSILLYYPDKDESAFAVAKKYGIPPEEPAKQLAEKQSPLCFFRK